MSYEVITLYQIHELAKACGITRKAIRYYEEKGFLQPKHDAKGRIYEEDDLIRLRCICYYRDMGLSIEQIQTIMAEKNSRQCLEDALKKRDEELQEAIIQKQNQLHQLQVITKAAQCQEPFDVGSIALDEDSDMVEGTIIWKLNNVWKTYEYRCSKRLAWHYEVSRKLLVAAITAIFIMVMLLEGGLIG